MTVLLIILYVLVCLFLVLVVLLQQGKGADLAGAFGGGGSATSFGPRSSTNIMHRMTTWSFVAFVLLSMTLAVLSGKQRTSVMESVASEPPATAESPTGAGFSPSEDQGAAPSESTGEASSEGVSEDEPAAGDPAATDQTPPAS